jgi:hypothetical protein
LFPLQQPARPLMFSHGFQRIDTQIVSRKPKTRKSKSLWALLLLIISGTTRFVSICHSRLFDHHALPDSSPPPSDSDKKEQATPSLAFRTSSNVDATTMQTSNKPNSHHIDSVPMNTTYVLFLRNRPSLECDPKHSADIDLTMPMALAAARLHRPL